MIEKIYNWFFSQPISIQISMGWLISCLLAICIAMIVYDPFVLITLILIGLSMAAIIRILLYYILDL